MRPGANDPADGALALILCLAFLTTALAQGTERIHHWIQIQEEIHYDLVGKESN